MKSWNDLTEDQKYSLNQYGISDEAGYNEISNLVKYSPELKAALEGEGSFDWNLIDKAKDAKRTQDEADYNARAQAAKQEAEAQAKAAYEQAKAQQERELKQQVKDELKSDAYQNANFKANYSNYSSEKYLYDYLKKRGYSNSEAMYLATRMPVRRVQNKVLQGSNDYWYIGGRGASGVYVNKDDWSKWIEDLNSETGGYQTEYLKKYYDEIYSRLRSNQAEIPVSEVSGWWDNPYQAETEQNVDRTVSKTDTSNTVPTAANGDYSGRENYGETQDAIAKGAQEAQQNAENQARSSASAGINKSRAGMLSENNSQQSQTNNVSNIYGANTAQNASTQADYLQKMAQADALDQQASNMRKGAGLTALGNGISGAMTGATVGATLGMSDERAKEAPNDNNNSLQDMIKQFRCLYKRLQELKGGK